MRVNVSYVQRCKATAHVFQVVLTFIAGCLTLAVLTKQGDTGGATKFFFATCFLTIPAIIYLVMVPMFSRAERFANVNAFLAVDALMTLLWFCSFISVAVWNANGIKQGAEEQKKPRNCDAFKYGPASKCKLSRVAVGFGAFIFIFFFVTAAISFYYLRSYRKNGVLPYETNKINPHHASGETTKPDNAWSTEIEPHRDSHDSDDDRRTEHGGGQHDDEYALLHSTDTDEGRHPGRPLSWGEERRHTGYAAYGDGASALSPGGYEEYRREASGQHAGYPPQGGYPAPGQGQGYSFGGGHER